MSVLDGMRYKLVREVLDNAFEMPLLAALVEHRLDEIGDAYLWKANASGPDSDRQVEIDIIDMFWSKERASTWDNFRKEVMEVLAWEGVAFRVYVTVYDWRYTTSNDGNQYLSSQQ